MNTKPIIYVCSPLRGDVNINIERARRYSRFVHIKGGIPITPHLYFTQFLDDEIKEERKAGIEMGVEILKMCNEIWVFGSHISEGMKKEIAFAKKENIPIKFFNIDCEQVEGELYDTSI